MGQWVTGTDYWPMTHVTVVTHHDLLTHLAHDPWPTDPLSALTLRSLALAREFGASIPRRVIPGHNHLKFLIKLGKRIINKHINFMKICMIFIPVFAGHPFGMDAWEWDNFHFSESQANLKPTRSVNRLHGCMLCLLHLSNTSFASQLGDRRDLVGLIVRPVWLKTLSLTAEVHGAEKICKASGRRVANESSLNKCSTTELLSCLFFMKMKETENFSLFKCPLVNETLWPETETFGFQSETETVPHFAETETRPRRLKNVLRPSRDRDVETESTTLITG